MATEQQIYEMGVRTDHPVFAKDFSTSVSGTSPFNSIINRLFARQMVKLQTAIASFQANSFPQSCDENTIDRWEETYFGYVKTGLTLDDRKAALLIKINTRLTMSLPDVISASIAITGQTPTVIRSAYYSGWVLDQSVLDFDTVFAGGLGDAQTYIVIFSEAVDSSVLKLLDDQLTKIEKGGSNHIFLLP